LLEYELSKPVGVLGPADADGTLIVCETWYRVPVLFAPVHMFRIIDTPFAPAGKLVTVTGLDAFNEPR
jgi:hypothetical protein